MHISLCGFGVVLVSPGGATTSIGGILTLVYSSVFCTLALLAVPMFLFLSFSLIFFLSFLGGYTPR